jgi:large subunit ribosomal protein L29
MTTELQGKTVEELKELEMKLREELFKLRVMHFGGQLQKSSELRKTRRAIARVLTAIRERELSA